jgi:hypothetical protein
MDRIQDLCRLHKVKSLWVFGSILSTDFRPDSDVDFLYELNHEHLSPAESNALFFGFIDAMERLLQHPIDMIWMGGVNNPYLLESIHETMQLVFQDQPTASAVGNKQTQKVERFQPFFFAINR